MSTLNRTARETLGWAGLTPRAWIEQHFPGLGRWAGDECGCTDDRCAGYHHDDGEPCTCLATMLEDAGHGRFPNLHP